MVLPKQSDIDKLLSQINKKVLKQLHLPASLNDLQAAYLSIPYFRDVYLYILHNKLPASNRLIRKLSHKITYDVGYSTL